MAASQQYRSNPFPHCPISLSIHAGGSLWLQNSWDLGHTHRRAGLDRGISPPPCPASPLGPGVHNPECRRYQIHAFSLVPGAVRLSSAPIPPSRLRLGPAEHPSTCTICPGLPLTYLGTTASPAVKAGSWAVPQESPGRGGRGLLRGVGAAPHSHSFWAGALSHTSGMDHVFQAVVQGPL